MTRPPESAPVLESAEHSGEVPSPDIELLFCNLNASKRVIGFGGVETYTRLLADMRQEEPDGYDGGLEITPTRALAASIALRETNLAIDDRPFAGAVHQAWAKRLGQALFKDHSAEDLGIALIMPEETASLRTMAAISRDLGGLPGVVFPDKRGNDALPAFTQLGINHLASQLSPEMFRDLDGDASFRSLYAQLCASGVRGIVVDTYHLQRGAFQDPDQKLNPQQVLYDMSEAEVPLTRIHVSAGRSDAKDPAAKAKSDHELKALLTGDPETIDDTAMGRILTQSYLIWSRQRKEALRPRPTALDPTSAQAYHKKLLRQHPKLPVTVEITHDGLAQALDGIVHRDRFVRIHCDITRTLRRYFEHIVRQNIA